MLSVETASRKIDKRFITGGDGGSLTKAWRQKPINNDIRASGFDRVTIKFTSSNLPQSTNNFLPIYGSERRIHRNNRDEGSEKLPIMTELSHNPTLTHRNGRRVIFPFLRKPETRGDNPATSNLRTCKRKHCRSILRRDSCPDLTKTELRDGVACPSLALNRMQRQMSLQSIKSQSVTFNPLIRVHEFELSDQDWHDAWYSTKDTKKFKRDAMLLRKKQNSPSETRESVVSSQNSYAHEIKSILLVNSSTIHSMISVKSIKKIIPTVKVTMTQSLDEAIDVIENEKKCVDNQEKLPTHGFDIIIIDGRLRATYNHNLSQQLQKTKIKLTGSKLIQKIANEQENLKNVDKFKQDPHRYSFLIQTAVNSTSQENQSEKNYADMTWDNSLLSFDHMLMDKVRKEILDKRQK